MALAYSVQVHQGGRSWLTVARCIDLGTAYALVPRYVDEKAVRIRRGGKDEMSFSRRLNHYSEAR